MKKRIMLVLIIVTLLMANATPIFADSPITSTDFSSAYLDLEIVNYAANTGVVDSAVASYLISPNNPIDVKAAVICALGWDFNGKNNADLYVTLGYGKTIATLDLDAMTGEELFCIGYLMAMDDYFDTVQAALLLEKACAKKNDSLTISLISAIVKTQEILPDTARWTEIWTTVDTVLQDDGLVQDLRPAAGEIIVDYMSLYSDVTVENPFTDRKVLTLQIGSPQLMVNGIEYELDPGRGTKPEIKENRTFLPISPIIKELGGQVSWESLTQKVTITLGEKTMELWIGETTAYLDGVPQKMEVAPYVSNARTMLPLRFIIENLGFDVQWDSATSQMTITADL